MSLSLVTHGLYQSASTQITVINTPPPEIVEAQVLAPVIQSAQLQGLIPIIKKAEEI